MNTLDYDALVYLISFLATPETVALSSVAKNIRQTLTDRASVEMDVNIHIDDCLNVYAKRMSRCAMYKSAFSTWTGVASLIMTGSHALTGPHMMQLAKLSRV